MIRSIMHDEAFLSIPCTQAVKQDMPIAMDLLDTLHAHQKECVGLAANMIGVHKQIIVMNAGLMDIVMFNPKIIAKKGPYEAEEGCLSLKGTRKTKRYKEITLEYEDKEFHHQKNTFTGWPAQILQHEIDHCKGILI